MDIRPAAACFDVAIVGGGPAGLSAALMLGRACRRVVLFDSGRPRNFAATAVHGFLGHDGIAPTELRQLGRREVMSYGVMISDGEITDATQLPRDDSLYRFELSTRRERFHARSVLLATGVQDDLPAIPGMKDVYGRLVHHCPYCDGWEHRQQHLVAFGEGDNAIALARTLRTWSEQVTACTNGTTATSKEKHRLPAEGIQCHDERLVSVAESDDSKLKITFADESSLLCGALFFSAGQGQRSPLPLRLGCEIDERGLVKCIDKQSTEIEGLFIAGDAHSDVQFAIVAAAEGAIAAAAINRFLERDRGG
jgi:thioredoxin reductase